MYRVLIVEDSATLRETLVAVFQTQPDFRVVGTSSSGQAATRLCKQFQPDLVTLDLMLPDVEGVEVIENIMAHTPTRILVVSSRTADGTSPMSMEALRAGALQVFHKTGLATDNRERFLALARSLCVAPAPKALETKKADPLGTAKIPTSARAGPVTSSMQLPRKTQSFTSGFIPRAPSNAALAAAPPQLPPRIIAIGASTGGPSALERLFKRIPADFALPIVVAQHMSVGFNRDLVVWMRTVTKLSVELAEPDVAMRKGTIYFAPDGAHITVREGGILKTQPIRPDELSCPSVDKLFQSVADAYGSASMGVVLTGMGDDGCVGLLAMRNRGARTVAQDEATSLIFGMPKMAIANDAARIVLGIDDIAAYIVDRARK